MQTLYGKIANNKLAEFCEIVGHKYENDEWKVVSDQVEYFQLVAPASVSQATRWQKKKGWLPIRDLNFQYAYYKCNMEIISAMKYTKEKLFEMDGEPIYLPEALARRASEDRGNSYNNEAKPSKSYHKILDEEREACKNRIEKMKTSLVYKTTPETFDLTS